MLSDDTLYGVTIEGGTNDSGIIFSVGTDGKGYKLMHDFSATVNNGSATTNSDGAKPFCTLTLSGDTLYGTTGAGGTNGEGVVFSINTDGSDFTVLYTFVPINIFNGSTILFEGGDSPESGVVVSGNMLYGTTANGGEAEGNIYGLNLSETNAPPQPIGMNALLSDGSLVLLWYSTNFSLQSTPALGMPFTTLSGATSPYIVPATNSQQYYRLIAN